MTDSTPVSPADPAQPALAPIRPEGYFGGIRLLAADVRVVTLLLDDARRRAMEQLLGIPPDAPSGLETLIVIAMFAGALRTRAGSRREAFRSHRQLSNSEAALIGFGALREVAYEVAGPWSRESSNFGTLLAFALVGAGARIAVRKSVHGVRAVSHEAYKDFHHRYGHLILRNRRRRAAATPGS